MIHNWIFVLFVTAIILFNNLYQPSKAGRLYSLILLLPMLILNIAFLLEPIGYKVKLVHKISSKLESGFFGKRVWALGLGIVSLNGLCFLGIFLMLA